jgi:uroporphyrinogen-III decarboxylase
MDQFFYLYADEREAMHQLTRRMKPFFAAALEAMLACSAEVVFWGANYDQDLTWPPFFKEEIAPWLQRVSARVHQAGKFLLTHTDGENRALLPLYPSCGFDVAESVCPHPMTHCTLAEIRAGMGPKTTVWGGIPSITLLEDVMDDQSFEAYLDTVFGALGTGERLILGVADNVPPDASLARLEQIKEQIEAFGAVQPEPK